MARQLSRRTLFAAAAAVAAVPVVAEAQTPATASREEDLKSARDSMANNAAQLAKVEVPMATEPAFSFKA